MQNRQEPVIQIERILSQKWLLFYQIQKTLIQNQAKSPLTPFRKSIIEWYLRAVKGGTFTDKRFSYVKSIMNYDLFLHMCSIFQTVNVNMDIQQPLKLYRCIYLNPNLVAPSKSLSHKIPSSWTFSKNMQNFGVQKNQNRQQLHIFLK